MDEETPLRKRMKKDSHEGLGVTIKDVMMSLLAAKLWADYGDAVELLIDLHRDEAKTMRLAGTVDKAAGDQIAGNGTSISQALLSGSVYLKFTDNDADVKDHEGNTHRAILEAADRLRAREVRR